MHPEAEAFLDAIFDAPDDNLPRLVYADWLQEHGHEEYAQFIRLQCSLQPRIPKARTHEQRKLLVEELWAAWQAFRARLPATVQTRFNDFHRFDRGMPHVGRYGDLTVTEFVAESPEWLPAPAPFEIQILCTPRAPLFGEAPYLAHVRDLRVLTRRDRWMHWSAGLEIDELPPSPEALGDDHFRDLLRSPRLTKLRRFAIDDVDVRASTAVQLLDAPFLESVRSISIGFRTTGPRDLRFNFSAAEGTDARRSAQVFWEEHRHRFRQ